ncbi:MAG: glycosyltransferase family 4 protein [Bacteroidota bacterium]|nr:glycosyltransferase family 4 protein [Bacteroidota bacterium]
MKLLILNYEYPPLGGGAGIVSKYHAEGLAKIGHQVTVLTAWFKGEKEIDERENLKIIKLKSKRRYDYKSTPDEWISWIFKSKRFLADYLVSNPQDYCLAHFALPGGEVAKYLHRKFNLPYAVISHGQDIPWFFPKQMFKYHLITYFWIKRICKKADKLILLTDAMKQNADRFMGKFKDKNIIIPNGCETTNFFPNYKKRSEKFKIIFAGRLVSQKSPFVFLKALSLLKKQIGSKFTVNILGNGDLKDKMQQFVSQNGLENEVYFKGWVSKREMLEEYQTAHVQVMSSAAEAMSIAALEAISSGVYLISTPVSGNTDIIEDGVNGEIFPFKDATVLSNKLEQYYKDKYSENYKVFDNFLSNFRKKYDWSSIVEEINVRILN